MSNSSHDNAQKPLTKKKRLFAKLRYEGELKGIEIANECGIGLRTVYDWDKEPEIQAEIKRLGRADTEKAIRYFEKHSMRAAIATVKLTETRPMKDAQGNIIVNKKGQELQEFIQPGEVVRKAAADILQSVNINIKGPNETGIKPNVHVYLPDNKRKDKEQGN